VTPAEHARLPDGWGRITVPGPSVPELVSRQAMATPDAVAVISGPHRLGYQDLDERANQLAHRLRAAGVGAESVVGVCLDRGVDLLVAVLGVLKAGGALLPLAPGTPPARLRTMVEDAAAVRVLSDARLAPAVSGAPILLSRTETAERCDPLAPPDPDQPAYVVYTSGSTGRPKGVVITHAGIANRVRWGVERYGLSAGDRFLHKTTIGFDAAMWELLGPLVSGGAVVMASPGVERDPAELMRAVRDHDVTVLQVVPSMLALLVDEPDLARLRLVFSAGEPLQVGLGEHLGTALHNTYGPTECSIDATAWAYRPGEPGPYAPIGTPIDNIRALVLDEDGDPAPIGVPGELHLGGVGLARGYLNQPALTAERFVPDPWPATPGARLYRTGDRVRLLDNGSLEFLGRLDRQVKVRGVRIEPAEVEAVLLTHPEVRSAVVTTWKDRLVAYVVCGEGRVPGLHTHVARRLQAQMVPSLFVRLTALPLLPNGKVDTTALPPPTVADRDHVPPRTPVEEHIARVWADVLGVDRVGVHDDFFALGGHSLFAVRAVAWLRRDLAVDLPLGAVFEQPTVAALAEVIAERPAAAHPPIRQVRRDRPLPLSFGQQRLLFLEQLRPGQPDYLTPLALRLRGPLAVEALRCALQEIVTRHEILRTRYAGGEAVIDPPGRFELAVETTDVAALTARPFELCREPPIRAHLVRLGPDEHVLVVAMHHIASDAWSMDVFAGELRELYRAFRLGRPSPLAPVTVQYTDFAAWQLASPLRRSLHYWRHQLDGLEPLRLPADRHRRPEAGDRIAEFVTVDVPVAAGRKVLEVGRVHGATSFMTMLAAFTVLLAHRSGQCDIAVATPTAGREHPDTEGSIGFFVNTLVLRTDVSGDPPFTDLLTRVRRTAVDAYTHQDLPFERLVHELRPDRDAEENPLVQVMFTMRRGPVQYSLDGLEVAELPVTRHWARLDLTLVVDEHPGGTLTISFAAAAALFDRATVQQIADDYVRLLTRIAADPTAPLGPGRRAAPSDSGVRAPTDPAATDPAGRG
jgi:amino acid adenylation domain-containing protein